MLAPKHTQTEFIRFCNITQNQKKMIIIKNNKTKDTNFQTKQRRKQFQTALKIVFFSRPEGYT